MENFKNLWDKKPAKSKKQAEKAEAGSVVKTAKMEKKMKREQKQKPKSARKKVLWITIPAVLLVLAAGAVLGWYFYFIYYLKPNFDEPQYQSIVSDKTGEVIPGEEITYTINLKNTGNTTVTDMAISTIVPGNCELVSSEPKAKFDEDTKEIVFNIGQIPKDTAESVSYTIKIDSPIDNGTVITTSEVIFNYALRDERLSFTINDVIENTVKSSPDFSESEFLMADLSGEPLNITDVVQFSLTVGNTGNMDARDIIVINRLPEKFEVFESSITFPAEFDKASNTLTWNIKEMPVGQSRTVKFRAGIGTGFSHLEKFKGTSSLVYNGNTVKEKVFEGEVYGYPNFSESSYTVADITGGSVWAGDVLKYSITVKNTGLREGKNFKLICPVPANTSLLFDSAGPHEGFEYISAENAVVWTIENLDMGQEKVFQFSVAINPALTGGGAIKSAFKIEGDEQYVELGEKTVGVRRYINHTVVCMGDSLIAYSNWPARLDGMLEATYPRAEYNTVGVGVPGMMSHQGYHKFDATVAPHGPQIIVFGFGSNDVGTSVNSFINGMTGLINKGKGIGATVIVHSIGYINTGIWASKSDYGAYNSALKALCAQQGVPFVDIYTPMAANPGKYLSDGLHLNSEGANLVAGLVFNTMRNYLDADGERR